MFLRVSYLGLLVWGVVGETGTVLFSSLPQVLHFLL